MGQEVAAVNTNAGGCSGDRCLLFAGRSLMDATAVAASVKAETSGVVVMATTTDSKRCRGNNK